MTIPTATYRLQFRNGMTFRRAMTLIPYLKRLGVSHLYASPVFEAAAGSTHGYDITDANRFDPALGTAEDFDALAAALTENGLGLILDIVPNHMAASLDNPWWRSVIERGQASPHAPAFDIDWNRRLTLPWLAKPFAEAVADGDIVLSADTKAGCLALSLPGLAVPLDPESYDDALRGDDGLNGRLLSLADVARREGENMFHMRLRNLLADKADLARLEARLAALSQDAGHLEDVHERQHFELIHWREAPKRLSYRRFFEVTELVGVNVEDARVFEDSHRLILELVRDGKVQGLRVDHVDGLSDPAAYLTRLRGDIGDETYLIVEKILEDGEDLPADWPVAGTTGYEFIDRLTHVLVERKGVERLRRQYAALGGLTDMAAGLYDARQSMISRNFAGEVSGLKRLAIQLALSEETHVDAGEAAIAAALKALLAVFPVYRTYGTKGALSENDARLVAEAAAKIEPALDPEEKKALDFIVTLLTGECAPRQTPRAEKFRRRFQQLTGPLMAKSLEDTLFYRQMPVLGLNEVGGNAGREEFLPRHFHAAMAERAGRWPLALSATSTHDTKRGEDARARLYALTAEPQPWIDGVTRWRATNSRHVTRHPDGPAPEPELEWALYQALLGSWPHDLDIQDDAAVEALLERLFPYIEKALREAKLRSDWTDPRQDYETAVKDYIAALLSPDNRLFLRDFHRTIRPYLRAGAWNGITQAFLKMTAPGIPDIYQGSERLDLSLVDPDNRREPDYASLQASLDGTADWPQGEEALLDGRLKQALIARALALRAGHRDLFEHGDYRPLGARGAMKEHVVAFLRRHGDRRMLVVAPRLPNSLMAEADGTIPAERWLDTAIDLPDDIRSLTNAFTGEPVEPQAHLRIAGFLADMPVALLLSD